MVARAKELGQPAIAMTDHGVMSGAIQFYKECKKQGVKPLIGCEVYVAQRGMLDKEAGKDNRPFHFTLLAQDRVGYKNLLALVSDAHTKGFYYKPRVDREMLANHAQGIVALSGCLRGEVNDALLSDDFNLAKKTIGRASRHLQRQLLRGVDGSRDPGAEKDQCRTDPVSSLDESPVGGH